ncbi:MAG TPA: hypothetical protein VFU63_08285 [Ktedonobacterales bacterium]|nr:hypothetical protein [Ktedonobacterales bacterium]
MFSSRLLRSWRTLRVLALLLVAVVVGWAIFTPPPSRLPARAASFSGWLSTPGASSGTSSEKGAGGAPARATTPAACAPLDVTCFLESFASSAAQSIMNAFTPVIDGFLQNPVNIVNQTPPVDSYQNTTIVTLNTVFVGVVSAALACLLVIGGYTILIGSHLRMPQASASELLARLVLVVGTVHFNLLFLGFFIDLENTLCQAVINATDTQVLTNTIANLLTFNPTTGLLLVILAILLGIMAVLLLVQMIARLATVDLLLALAPLGLGCLLLPQTVRWGRLWLTAFSAAVWVQFIQVVALALGSVFLSAVNAPGTVFHGNVLATAFLAIGTMGLVLRIPNMLHHWALSPMWQGGQRQGNSGGADALDAEDDGGGGGGGWYADGGNGAGWAGNTVEGTIVSEESGSTLLFLA